MTDMPLRGRLLVATPSLTDGNFAHAVVLVLEHHDEGAVGVVVNRPSEAALADTLPEWAPRASGPEVIFVGGPVQRDAMIALGRSADTDAGEQLVLPGVAVVDLAEDPGRRSDIEAVRVFAGYSGWGAGQLETEIEAGGWFVVDALPDDVFAAHPEDLWRRVMRRQGGVYTTIPRDPSHN